MKSIRNSGEGAGQGFLEIGTLGNKGFLRPQKPLRPLRDGDFGVGIPHGPGICGIDEAGRGPLAGPVAAAAVILPREFPLELLDDSKVLSVAKRERAYVAITHCAIAWAVGWATHQEIGSFNILGASLLAMRRAYLALGIEPELVFVDGNRPPELGRPVATVIGGDALLPSIMAASILAKVARDRVMELLDGVSPEYGFARHKGYPTREHRAAVKRLGPSLWQRPGFRC
jgi:ribonuclease HII